MQNFSPDFTGVRSLALLSSYAPRQCGIAMFARDLRSALVAERGESAVTVLAMDDRVTEYAYPAEVRFQIPAQRLSAYRTAADLVNINRIDVALVQHEYGLFGGRDGSHVLELMRRLRMPILTTLHTVLREPTPGQRKVLDEICRLSERVVVMSRTAQKILEEAHAVPQQRIVIIPHGIPDMPFSDPSFYKDQFGVEGCTVLLTFGLLSPGKGIETALRAMPQILERHPEVVYIILGATHPHVLHREGDAYRVSLERLVDRLGLRDHVAFHNRFVTQAELCGYLGAADLYISPYPNEAQIVSGTLAYALGAGKAIIATPYRYARELLAEGRGELVPFEDPDALAEGVVGLLDRDVERHAMRKRAYMHGRTMVWKEVGRHYLGAAADALRDRSRNPRPVSFFGAQRERPVALPRLKLDHLRRLTDPTGILQHATHSVPNRRHGYSTDDNARALLVALMAHEQHRDPELVELAYTYLSFLHHAFDPRTKRFRNYLGYDRRWIEEQGSEDVSGRALWALGTATRLAPSEGLLSFAARLFLDAVGGAVRHGSPRAWAFSLLGMQAYLERFPGDTFVRRTRREVADRLHGSFTRHAAPDWPWPEEVLTYDNAKLPHALLLSGRGIPDPEMVASGLRTLEWLVDLQRTEEGVASLIGNDGWYARNGRRARFDQQPVDAMALVEACAEAYRCTAGEIWIKRAHLFLDWFLGANETHSLLYDYATGGCRDGLHADGPNLNEGAESTLSWLISLLTVLHLDQERSLFPAIPIATEEPGEPVGH